VCTGGKTCPVRAAAAGTVCRADTGDCDVQEVCDGSSESCPTNGVASSTTVCNGINPPYTGPSLPDETVCAGTNTCVPTHELYCDNYRCSGTSDSCSTCVCVCIPIQ
jgi:hypothetical protein